MNYPHRASDEITDPPALLFRITDRLRLEACVTAMVQDGMSLALTGLHESTLDHYGKLLLHRLRLAAPGIALEIYFPASVEALLARFNDALRDHTVEGAMLGEVQNSAPRIWILHDAGALPDHEIELLARLIEHFPGANIRILLLLNAGANKHQLLEPFRRRILRWEIEPPTPEQAEAMLTQARSQGREGEALSLLQLAPAVQVVNAAPQTAETAQNPPQSSTPSKKRWRTVSAVAVLLLASTGTAFVLYTGTWAAVADDLAKAVGNVVAKVVAALPTQAPANAPVQASASMPEAAPAEVPAGMPAAQVVSAPAEPASASSGAVTPVQSVVVAQEAVEEVIARSAQGLDGTAWLQQQPAQAYIVQHTTEPSFQAATQWVKDNTKVQDAQIIPMYLAGNSAVEFAVVSGPFTSLSRANKFAKRTASGNASRTYTVNFLKEKSAVPTTPAPTPKRKENTR